MENFQKGKLEIHKSVSAITILRNHCDFMKIFFQKLSTIHYGIMTLIIINFTGEALEVYTEAQPVLYMYSFNVVLL